MRLFRVLVVLGAGVAIARPVVVAQELDQADATRGNPTLKLVEEGAFAPLSMPARVGSAGAFAWGLGGYDSSRKGPVFDSSVEVRLWGPIALRGGATYSNGSSRLRPNVGARAQFLRQESHGLDGALGVFYRAEGFTEAEGEIETFLSMGRRFGSLSVTGSLVYGQDPEGNERDGEVRLAVAHQRGRFAVGLDSRARIALGTQGGKAASTEPTFDAMGGPLATVVVGPIAAFAELGPSAFRLAGSTRVGAAALAGLGTAF
jgi:hypothetical protein